MDALLMCGGRGTRLETDAEKPLFEVGGRPMVDRVRDALADSPVETTYAVVSPRVPRTRRHLDDLPVIDTPGAGYVADLDRALRDDRVRTPMLTVAADLPLLDGEAVDAVLRAHDGSSLAACVPAALKRRLGLSAGATLRRDGRELAPAGVNVVAGTAEESTYATDDVRLAVNVNRLEDARVAEALL